MGGARANPKGFWVAVARSMQRLWGNVRLLHLIRPLLSPHGCLVGRPANRIKVGTRQSKAKISERKFVHGEICSCIKKGLMVVGRRALRYVRAVRTFDQRKNRSSVLGPATALRILKKGATALSEAQPVPDQPTRVQMKANPKRLRIKSFRR